MSIYARFFGQHEDDDNVETDLIAMPNSGDGNPIGLQVLFAGPLNLDGEAISVALRETSDELAEARCELATHTETKSELIGLAGWGDHVLQLVGFNNPMPETAVEACVAPAHYAQELKDQARAHASHVLLWYAGKNETILERYVSLALLAGTFAKFGGVAVLNETAHTSLPVAALGMDAIGHDLPETFRTMPWPFLFCGFVKMVDDELDGVWMRTYGAHVFGLPDFAALAESHDQGSLYFNVFDSLLKYLDRSEAYLAAGHTSQIEDDVFLRFRDPTDDETFLDSEGELLVVERIDARDINR